MILPVLGVIIAHVLSIWTLEYSSPQIDTLRDYGFDKKTTIIVLLHSVPASATFDFFDVERQTAVSFSGGCGLIQAIRICQKPVATVRIPPLDCDSFRNWLRK